MKKFLLLIAIVMCCFTASAVGTQPSVGDGSKGNPYQIATIENLLWFADYVNAGNTSANAILTADITMNTGVLDSNGDLNGGMFTSWTPIGGQDGKDFGGEFNGDGHTISGLYFKDTWKNDVGLFGKTASGAYIHDLGIKDSYFYGRDHVGGICGDFAYGKIENCWNGATVKAENHGAGGIAGSCGLYASIKDCYNIGQVSASSDESPGGTPNTSFGGICGVVYSTTTATYSIDNCYTKSDPNCNRIYGDLEGGCPASKIHNSYVKNAEAFTSGEVCYRLNNGVTNGSQKWYQTLDDDPSPVLNNSRGTVYFGYDGEVLKYSNTMPIITTTKHEQCAATCNSVGYSQDCWEITNSGKIYAEEACVNELNAAAVISYMRTASAPTYQINQGELTGWSQEVNETYDGVNFAYATKKVFENYGTTTEGTILSNYKTDEWVSFKVAENNPKNARLKWAWKGGQKDASGKYGQCTLTYKINNGTEITISSTSFEVLPDVYVLNLDGLNKDDVVEFHIKEYKNTDPVSSKATWAVTLEYVSSHKIEHHTAKAATCTENGNNENWHCTKCNLHFTSAECTTEMNDWEIPALGHTTEYRAQKAATCTEDGNIEHWHCTVCGLNYSDEACTSQITGDVVLPKIGHKNKQHYARVEATCLTDGNIEYWYCPDCKTNYIDEACTASTTETTLAALGHDFTHTTYKVSTCTSEGEVEHWHCNRCQKDFNIGEEMASEEHVISGSLIIPCKESDAIVVGMDEGQTIDDCHTFTTPTKEGETTVATVTFGENGQVTMDFGSTDKKSYTISESESLETFFSHTFTLKANQDPDHKSNYYSTFYTGEYAYKVPEATNAYAGAVESGNETDMLKMTNIGNIIHKGEPVVLRATGNSITLMPSCNDTDASTPNILEGTDEPKTLGANQYALSLGQHGVGFYLFSGNTISAHKAFVTLNKDAIADMLMFSFDDGTTTGIKTIDDVQQTTDNSSLYDLQGRKVISMQKGQIYIKNGKKYVQN